MTLYSSTGRSAALASNVQLEKSSSIGPCSTTESALQHLGFNSTIHWQVLNRPPTFEQRQDVSKTKNAQNSAQKITQNNFPNLNKTAKLASPNFSPAHTGLRDRALLGVLAYTFARIGAVVNLKVEDYYPSGKRFLLRFKEKGGKEKELPVHHKLEELLDQYLKATGLEKEPGRPHGAPRQKAAIAPIEPSTSVITSRITANTMRSTWVILTKVVPAGHTVSQDWACHLNRCRTKQSLRLVLAVRKRRTSRIVVYQQLYVVCRKGVSWFGGCL